MLASKKNRLTMSVLGKLRRQGAPKAAAGLVSELGESREELPENLEEEVVESKSGLVPTSRKKPKPAL